MQDDERRWQALTRRDGTQDGTFVYAVLTTGIYCKPSCPSRQPQRANVRTFDTVQDAVAAGFRACKRCRPDQQPGPDARLARAIELLSKTPRPTNQQLADQVGLSAGAFQRLFKRSTGVTPQTYRRRVLAERAREALADGRPVSDAVYEAGYSGPSRFYEGIGRDLGMAPRAARAQGAGETVWFDVRPCSLGAILVAWTEVGIARVDLGEDSADLELRLRRELARATLVQVDGAAQLDALLLQVERGVPAELPLDIRGTAFQQRVWDELRRIPSGETRGYADIARALDHPTASRAVARACATNSIALLIPCHRVVRGDGGLAGYRWGVERKRELLAREHAGNPEPE